MPPPKPDVSQKKKDECNARAQEIVVKLIDGIDDEEQFLEQLRWVNQNHYEDINEERAISKVCGYPLCEQILGHIPKKKYHISISQNKVYDITERKLFCSNQCYKANLYLKSQLHTIPLWLGDRDECETFTLLKNHKELIGDEVNFEIERARIPEEHQESESVPAAAQTNVTERLTERSTSDSSISKTHVVSEPSDQSVSTKDTRCFERLNATKTDNATPVVHSDIIERTSSDSSIIKIHVESDQSLSTSDDRHSKRSKAATASKLSKSATANSEPSTQSVADLVRHVEHSMREWLTIESLKFILGEQVVIDKSQENNLILDKEDVEPPVEPESKPLSDFEALRKQTEEIENKVKEFYRGDRKVTFATEKKDDFDETKVERINVLPVIHHHVQNTIRRNVVLSKLKFVFPDLCDVLALNLIDISSKVKQLMCTCCFSAHNITFKPFEWKLIGLIILNLLSVQDSSIQSNLRNKSRFVNAILESYNLKTNYLDCTTAWLTNRGFIHKKGDS